MTADPPYERNETEMAAAEAAAIGGRTGDERLDPAERPVKEAGGGEAEGFEESEAMLIDHASHGDQRPAHTILYNRSRSEERNARREDAEADHEASSEINADEPPERI